MVPQLVYNLLTCKLVIHREARRGNYKNFSMLKKLKEVLSLSLTF